MGKIVDLMADLEWSEADLDNRIRHQVASVVSEARQSELRTIMLGHIAGMRTATAKEMGEILLTKQLVEEAGLDLIEGRADMALLREVWQVESAIRRLAEPLVDESETDAQERSEAEAVIAYASDDVLELAEGREAARPRQEEQNEETEN